MASLFSARKSVVLGPGQKTTLPHIAGLRGREVWQPSDPCVRLHAARGRQMCRHAAEPREKIEKIIVPQPDFTETHDRKMMAYLQDVTEEVMRSYAEDEYKLDFETTEHRPDNPLRSLTHALSAVLIVVLCQTVLADQVQRLGIAACVAGATWTWEIGRRRSAWFDKFMVSVFRLIGMHKIFHKEEWQKVTSWTWYVSALVFLCCIPCQPAAYAGLLVLGFGDPAAGYVGRRWGRTGVPGVKKKTFEGALGFMAVGFLASFIGLLACFGHSFGTCGVVLVSFGATVGGCIGEIFHTNIWKGLDDNFSVPVGASLAGWAMFWAAGFHV